MTKTDYTAGQRVEVDNYIFECRVDADDIIDYAIYCNIALPYELTEEQQGLWNDAWVSISSCYRTETPTAAPSTLEPSAQPTKSPTGSPTTTSPSSHPTTPPSVSPIIEPTTSSPTSHPTIDVDECSDGTHSCDANAECTNTRGSYQCECNDGYTGNGFECSNIDECATDTDDCDERAQCTDTEGSYACECPDGWIGDGKVCETASPTVSPSEAPSRGPSQGPTSSPTLSPTSNPSKSPTVRPSVSPSAQPSTGPSHGPSRGPPELVTCPEPYDSLVASTYVAGTKVEVNNSIYRCRSYPYAYYCTQSLFAPEHSANHLWDDAWATVGSCQYPPTISPSVSPSTSSPTLTPSTSPTTSPSTEPTSNPTLKPSVASTEPSFSLSLDPSAASLNPSVEPSWNPTSSPSKAPSNAPIVSVESAPAVELATCPEPYDSLVASTYVAGTKVELNNSIYRCQPFPYSFYCTQALFAPEHSANHLWGDAWATVGPCQQPSPPTSTPTTGPSMPPSASPTMNPTSRPSIEPSTNPTSSLSAAPSIAPVATVDATPTEELVTCPEPYDPLVASTYVAGTKVELNNSIYQCQPFPYSFYCTQALFAPEHSENQLWTDTWATVGPCQQPNPTASPSKKPSEAGLTLSSASPSTAPTASPSKPVVTSSPSVSPVGTPTAFPSRKPSINPSMEPTQGPSKAPTETVLVEPAPPYGIPLNPDSFIIPHERFTAWEDLTSSDRNRARNSLDYDEDTWNQLGENAIEEWVYGDLYNDEMTAVQALGMDEAMWDCWMNHYGGHYWSNLQTLGVDHYWEVLGWNKRNWEGDEDEPDTEDLWWDDLTEEQQAAAAQVCYRKYIWNGEIIPDWPETGAPTPSPIVQAATQPITQPPSNLPSSSPTRSPSASPSKRPSSAPTRSPITFEPSKEPSASPVTREPTKNPTQLPSTSEPSSASPTKTVSQYPSISGAPNSQPSDRPSVSDWPSSRPSSAPTTMEPSTREPSISPSRSPVTSEPSRQPSASPVTGEPTKVPSGSPSTRPTISPTTRSPTHAPSHKVTDVSTAVPSVGNGVPANAVSSTIPAKRYIEWTQLENAEKTFAKEYLGYDKSSWNNPGSSEVENWAFDDLYDDEKVGAEGLGYNAESWDCWQNHYVGYYWDDLVENELDQYFALLGWNNNNWDGNADEPDTENMSWNQLSLEQQGAATQVCYNELLWNGESIGDWSMPGLADILPEQQTMVTTTSSPTTRTPSRSPSASPVTSNPTGRPTVEPSISPSQKPSTHSPSSSPSQKPSTHSPSYSPSQKPSTQRPRTQPPSRSPTISPSTNIPTARPSSTPSSKPTSQPTVQPTTPVAAASISLSNISLTQRGATPISFGFPANPVADEVPGMRYMSWSSLSSHIGHAISLGYDQDTWKNPATADIEAWSYHDLYDDEIEAVEALGIGDDAWDCHINHFFGYWWEDIEFYGYDVYFRALGWDLDSWENDAPAPTTEDMYWDELTPEQQAAASQLCYFRDLWDMIGISDPSFISPFYITP